MCYKMMLLVVDVDDDVALCFEEIIFWNKSRITTVLPNRHFTELLW